MTTNIDPKFLKATRPQIDAALKELGEKLGVSISAGNASCERDGSAATFQLKISSLGEDGEVVSENLRHLRKLYPEAEGKLVKLSGKDYKIVGYKPRARSKPVVIESLDNGKEYITGMDCLHDVMKLAA